MEHIASKARFYRNLSEIQYRSACGADRIDAERNRLTATALGKVLLGWSVEEALAWYQAEWAAFAREQNAKVEAAPRLKYGPMAGCSSIQYLWASPCNGEQGEINIRMACNGLTRE